MRTINQDAEILQNTLDESQKTNERQNCTIKSKNNRVQWVWDLFEQLCYTTGRYIKKTFRLGKWHLPAVTKDLKKQASVIKKRIQSSTVKLKQLTVNFTKESKYACQKSKDFFAIFQKKVRPALRQKGLKGAKAALQKAMAEGKQKNKRIIWKTCNVLAPALALVVFVSAVAVAFNLNYVLKVNYSDREVGYIENEKTYEQAQSKLVEQIAFPNQKTEVVQKESFTLSVAPKKEVKDAEALAEDIVSKSSDEDGFQHAYGIYVDNEFIAACADGDKVAQALDQVLQPYREQEGNKNAVVRFHQQVEVDSEAALYRPQYINEPSALEEIIRGSKQKEVTYTVKEGDTFASVAKQNDMTTAQLKEYNNGLKEEKVSPGDTLVVAKQQKLLQVEVVKEITYKEEIHFESEEIKSDEYDVGYRQVNRTGEKGEREITAQVIYLDGQEYRKDIIENKVLKKPVNQQLTIGTRESQIVNEGGGSGLATAVGGGASAGDVVGRGGKLGWPTASGYISCGWLGYAGHRGIDIAAPHGTPIYAADDGVVTASGWSDGGYGYYIMIDHGNGMETLYGHCSSLYVGEGAIVTRGQTIAGMGTTGLSTGNHLHFEVRIGGERYDPIGYL